KRAAAARQNGWSSWPLLLDRGIIGAVLAADGVRRTGVFLAAGAGGLLQDLRVAVVAYQRPAGALRIDGPDPLVQLGGLALQLLVVRRLGDFVQFQTDRQAAQVRLLLALAPGRRLLGGRGLARRRLRLLGPFPGRWRRSRAGGRFRGFGEILLPDRRQV